MMHLQVQKDLILAAPFVLKLSDETFRKGEE
jgi:hypothetical protein